MNKVTVAAVLGYTCLTALVVGVAIGAQQNIPLLAAASTPTSTSGAAMGEATEPDDAPTTWQQWTTSPEKLQLWTAKPPVTADSGNSFVFPVNGPVSYKPEHDGFPATDVFTECGTDVVSPASATVKAVTSDDPWTDGGEDKDKTGRTVLIEFGETRLQFAHLESVAVRPGDKLQPGMKIGAVGESGDPSRGGCQVQIGMSPKICNHEDWWIMRGVMNPFNLLQSWQTRRAEDPSEDVTAWHGEHQCPADAASVP